MTYDFKKLQELAWVAVVSAAIVVLQIIVASESIGDWQTWVIGVGGAAARAAAGAVLAVITKPSG